MTLQLIWIAVFFIAGVLFTFRAEVLNQDHSANGINSLAMNLVAVLAHSAAVFLSFDRTIQPFYTWISKALPDPTSILHSPTAVILTVIVLFTYLLIVTISVAFGSESLLNFLSNPIRKVNRSSM